MCCLLLRIHCSTWVLYLGGLATRLAVFKQHPNAKHFFSADLFVFPDDAGFVEAVAIAVTR